MKKYIVVFIALLTSFFFYAQVAQKGTHNVDVGQFKAFEKQEKKLLLDVRTPNEYQQGHIDGAKNLDYFDKSFKTELAKFDKGVPVYVYCRSGGRSAKAMQIMKEMGFETVYNLKGGYLAWSQHQ
ncbi:MAG: rhodanese-like domain-containing protein [Flavobacteriales bacterium]|jgi:rhodanese-related sulfurtransferase|nr:rhodanese-like domain-containing protein [Flavobacteriales bacterium]